MRCSSCGHENPTEARFCEGCGATLTPPKRSCSSCGAVNSADARFCIGCGATLPTVAAPAPVRAETPVRAGSVPALICPNCGARNRADLRFCEQCAAPLRRRSAAGSEARAKPPLGAAWYAPRAARRTGLGRDSAALVAERWWPCRARHHPGLRVIWASRDCWRTWP
jgi:predicted amidophosphoribosyltransferase